MVPCTAWHLHARAPCALTAPRGSPIRAPRRSYLRAVPAACACARHLLQSIAPPARVGALHLTLHLDLAPCIQPCTSLCIWTWRLASSHADRGSPIRALRRLASSHAHRGSPIRALRRYPACGALHHPCTSRLSYSAHRGAYPRVVLYTPAPVPAHILQFALALVSVPCTSHCGSPIPHMVSCTIPAPRGSPNPRTAVPHCEGVGPLPRAFSPRLSYSACHALRALLHRGSPIPRATPCVRYSIRLAALLFRAPQCPHCEGGPLAPVLHTSCGCWRASVVRRHSYSVFLPCTFLLRLSYSALGG